MAADLVPSFKNALKRSYDIERSDWDADIKVDYDKPTIPVRKVKGLVEFLRRRRLSVNRVKVCRTRKGYHLRIWLSRPIGPYTALAAQKALGDDPIRHGFNTRRVRKKRSGWNVLFNEKWRGDKCIMKEEFSPEMTTKVEGILKGESS